MTCYTCTDIILQEQSIAKQDGIYLDCQLPLAV